MMRHLFRKFRENSPVHNTVTGLSERAEGLLTKAVEIWQVGVLIADAAFSQFEFLIWQACDLPAVSRGPHRGRH